LTADYFYNTYPEIRSYVNIAEGLARVVNHTAIYKKVLTSFLSSAYFEEFSAQVEAGDQAALSTIHTLKGVTANLSLAKINALCIQVEQKMKQGESVLSDIATMTEVMNKTKEYVQIIVNEI
jgi:HPt (histidine-containing phosphotransfer) domain-containing protein